MICNVVDDKLENDGINRTITIVIKDIDNYKFRRWLDLANSFDDLRKASKNYRELLHEIENDYDKDDGLNGTI